MTVINPQPILQNSVVIFPKAYLHLARINIKRAIIFLMPNADPGKDDLAGQTQGPHPSGCCLCKSLLEKQKKRYVLRAGLLQFPELLRDSPPC